MIDFKESFHYASCCCPFFFLMEYHFYVLYNVTELMECEFFVSDKESDNENDDDNDNDDDDVIGPTLPSNLTSKVENTK